MAASARDGLTAIVVAAGSAQRFGQDKLFLPLAGRPVLAWSLLAFETSPWVGSIVLVLSQGNLQRGRRLVARTGLQKVREICAGGRRRQDSAWRGLEAAAGAEWVLIHDGARPFVTPELIERGFLLARDVGGSVAAVPVHDTIKIVDHDNLIQFTPRRANLWAAQTPQFFRYELLVEAYGRNGDQDVTDDAELLERAGRPVAVYPGSYDNVKITTPEDLPLARAIARRRARRTERIA